MADRIQQRRDTAARWSQYNPILLEGEVGYELDTDQYKLGDGEHAWNDLPYRGAPCLQQTGTSTTTPMSQKAVTDELALLNSNTGVDEYPAFSASTTYAIGDVVNYNGKLYQFTADHAAGAWTEIDVKKTNLKSEIISKKGITYTTSNLINDLIEELFINTGEDLTARISIGNEGVKFLVFENNYSIIVAQFLIQAGFSEKVAGTVDAYCVMRNIEMVSSLNSNTEKYEVISPTDNLSYSPYINSCILHKNDDLIFSLDFNQNGYIMGADRSPHLDGYIEGGFSKHETQKSTDFINIECYKTLKLSLINKPEASSNNSLMAGAALYSEPNFDVVDGEVPSLVAVLFGNLEIELSDYPTAKYIIFNEGAIIGEQKAVRNNVTLAINETFKNKNSIDSLKIFTKNDTLFNLFSEIYVNTDESELFITITKGLSNNWLVVRKSDNTTVVAQFPIIVGLQKSVIEDTDDYVVIKEANLDKFTNLDGKIQIFNYNKIELSPTIYAYIQSKEVNEAFLNYKNASGLNFSTYLDKSNTCIATLIDDDAASIEAVNNIKSICDIYGIKCTFATIIDRWYEGLSDNYIEGMKDLLISFQDLGFNFMNHSLKHDQETWKFQYLLENDGIDWDAIEADMCKSRRLMKEAGFLDCNYINYPWGLVSGSLDNYQKAVSIADKYFDAGVATYRDYGNYLNIKANNPINALTRMQIYKNVTLEQIKTYVDNCYNNGAWCIIYCHSNDSSNFDENLLKQGIEYIQSKGINFKTFHEGFKIKRGIYELKNNAS